MNKPVDGWNGHGSTGNVNSKMKDENAPEPTGNQLYDAAINLEKHLVQRSGVQDFFSEKEKPVQLSPQNLNIITSSSHEPSRSGPVQRKKALEFFEYHDDDDDKDVDEMKTLPSQNKQDDDGLVYSRVHGYRIKIAHEEDTSLAYKKVLGDIKVSKVRCAA